MQRANSVLILTPRAWPDISGNAITVERWRRSLIQKGLRATVHPTEGLGVRKLSALIASVRPDVVHAHHVSRAGAFFLAPHIANRWPRLPLVVSPAGTDLFPQMGQPYDKEAAVGQVCRKANVIVTQGDWTAKRLATLFPDVKGRIIHVPKAFAWFGNDPCDLRTSAGLTGKHCLFFFPAGIRPVKRNLETLLAMREVETLRPHVYVVFAGPAVHREYAARFQEEVMRSSAFASWIPVIPHEAMRSAYESADIVLNGSSSEGLSNAVLEAIAAGRPLLASDIPGNRWPICGDGQSPPCGLLFTLEDRGDFVQQALKLVDDRMLRNELSQGSRHRAAIWPTPDEEAGGLIGAYERAMAGQARESWAHDRSAK